MRTDYPQALPMFVPQEWVFVERSGYKGELSLVVHKTASPGQTRAKASFALIADICKRHHIPAERIFAHHSLEPIDKARCPGNYPLDELRAYIAGRKKGS